MIAAPRFCGADKFAFEPFPIADGVGGEGVGDLRVVKSGYCVAEWLPQMQRWKHSRPRMAFWANCVLARFSSRRVMAKNRSLGTSGALFMAIRQFVAGVADHQHARIAGGVVVDGLALAGKILPLMPSRSPRSMPSLRGTLPTSRDSWRH